MQTNFGSRRARKGAASLLLVLLSVSAQAAVQTAVQTNAATEALIDKVVALNERGDPATMEKTTSGYLIDAVKRFNAGTSDDTWKSVRSDVNEIISNKIRP